MKIRTKVFISYSHKNPEWRDRIRAALLRDHADDRLVVWDDRQIEHGDEWRAKLFGAIDETAVAVLLVSPEFLKSEFIWDDEIPAFLRAREDGLAVYWIPVEGDYSTHAAKARLEQLARFQSFDPRRPLAAYDPGELAAALTTIRGRVWDFLASPISPDGSPQTGLPPILPVGDEEERLLHSKRWIDLVGREKEAERLNAFLAGESPFRWWAVLGDGGVGKSRLVGEFARSLDAAAWDIHIVDASRGRSWLDCERWKWMDASAGVPRRWTPRRPTLLAIDYAIESPTALRALIQWCSEERFDHPFRLLMLDRVGSYGPWVSATPGGAFDPGAKSATETLLRYYYHEPVALRPKDDPATGRGLGGRIAGQALVLRPLAGPRDWKRVVEQVASRLGGEGQPQRPVPPLEDPFWKRVAALTDNGKPLLLQLFAILWSKKPSLFDPEGDGAIGDRNRLLREWLDREVYVQWKKLCGEDRALRRDVVKLVGFATFCRGARHDEVFPILPRLLGREPVDVDELADIAHAIVRGDDHLIPPLPLDLLGVMFIVFGGTPRAGHVHVFDAGEWIADAARISPRGLCVTLCMIAYEVPWFKAAENWLREYLAIARARFGAGDRHTSGPALSALLWLIGNCPGIDEEEHHAKIAEKLRAAIKVDQADRDEALLIDADVLFFGAMEAEPFDEAEVARRFDLAAAYYALHYGNRSVELAERLRVIGGYWESVPRYERAIVAWLRALRILEEAKGPEATELFEPLMDLGAACWRLAKFQEAFQFAERARSIALRRDGASSARFGSSLSLLGFLLREQGRYSEAEPRLRDSLCIVREALGPNHPNVAAASGNLAWLLRETNRHAEAEPLYRDALRIDLASFGPDHPDVAIASSNLAWLLRETNRHAEAEPLYRDALRIDLASFGPDHPSVAVRLGNLALLLRETNRHAEAEPLFRDTLRIDLASFGPDHPRVATASGNLASLLQDTNRHAEAEPLFRDALRIDLASFGPNHPNVAIDLGNLARLLADLGRGGEAVKNAEEALRIEAVSFANDHWSLAVKRRLLAQALLARNEPGDAAQAALEIERALKILRAAFSPEHWRVADALRVSAKIRRAQGDHAGAADDLREAARIELARKPIALLDTAKTHEQLADALAAAGDAANDAAKSAGLAKEAAESLKAGADFRARYDAQEAHARAMIAKDKEWLYRLEP